jgi:hypothetical protein
VKPRGASAKSWAGPGGHLGAPGQPAGRASRKVGVGRGFTRTSDARSADDVTFRGGAHDRLVPDPLEELRAAAAERRAARRRLADLTAEHGNRSPAREPAREAYAEATARWSQLIREAVAAGHTKADVARAAGCPAPSLCRHLTD